MHEDFLTWGVRARTWYGTGPCSPLYLGSSHASDCECDAPSCRFFSDADERVIAMSVGDSQLGLRVNFQASSELVSPSKGSPWASLELDPVWLIRSPARRILLTKLSPLTSIVPRSFSRPQLPRVYGRFSADLERQPSAIVLFVGWQASVSQAGVTGAALSSSSATGMERRCWSRASRSTSVRMTPQNTGSGSQTLPYRCALYNVCG